MPNAIMKVEKGSSHFNNTKNKTNPDNENEEIKLVEIRTPEKDSIKTRKEEVDLESMLRELKIYGHYHLKLMFLVGSLALATILHSTNYVFAVENVGYRCGYTELSEAQTNSSDKRKLYDSNSTYTEENFDVTNVTVCVEWIYDKPDSFVAEFNLGGEDWKRTLVGTMHSAGYMLGLFLVGPLSDKFGRKKLIIWTSIIRAVTGTSKSMVYSYWMYVALETLEALLGNSYSATFTLAIESVTKQHRHIIMFLVGIFVSSGGMTLAVIAWLTPNWRIFLRSIYAPGLIFILYIFWMDESIRWLLNKGKKAEVGDIIRKAAKLNNVVIDEDKLSQLKCGDSSSNVNLSTLLKMTFSSKKLLLRLLCCICMWFTALFSFYSLMINAVSLKGNKYLNYGLTMSTGILASVTVLYLLPKFNRRKPLILSLLLTGTFCVAHWIIPSGYVWLSTLLYISGKFCSAIGMCYVYLYTSELFPTCTRNTLHALCSALGRTAAIIAPQTPLLLRYGSGVPSLVVGSLSLVSALIMMLMPDTAEDVLPDTVQQAEALGTKHISSEDGSASKTLI